MEKEKLKEVIEILNKAINVVAKLKQKNESLKTECDRRAECWRNADVLLLEFKQKNEELKLAVMAGVVMLFEQYPEETKKRFSLEELVFICKEINKLRPKQVEDIFYEVLFGKK